MHVMFQSVNRLLSFRRGVKAAFIGTLNSAQVQLNWLKGFASQKLWFTGNLCFHVLHTPLSICPLLMSFKERYDKNNKDAFIAQIALHDLASHIIFSPLH